MDQEPDVIQTLWLVRGSFSMLAGLAGLVAVFAYGYWQFYLLVAVAGFGFGAFDFWLALTSMAGDRRHRLSAPSRVESAEHGLDVSGWARANEKQPDSS